MRSRALGSGTELKMGSNGKSGSPGIGVVAPGIGARLDADEAIVTVRIGDTAASAREVRIKRCLVLVHDVAIAAGRIALPDLDKAIGHRPPSLIAHPPLDDNALAQRL